LRALRHEGDAVLLIDEVDKVDFEFEALLLEILSDFQVTIPELGTVKGTRHPFVVLTSNNTRELSEALKRRALYLYLDYPDLEREKEIVLTHVPDAPEALADQLVRVVRSLRQLELKKPPSISETLDWARTLLELGFDSIDEDVARSTLNVLLKYQQDVQKASGHLKLPPRPEMN
jgi:MoxR-like ATPase